MASLMGSNEELDIYLNHILDSKRFSYFKKAINDEIRKIPDSNTKFQPQYLILLLYESKIMKFTTDKDYNLIEPAIRKLIDSDEIERKECKFERDSEGRISIILEDLPTQKDLFCEYGRDILIIEEMAHMDPQVFYQTIVPTLITGAAFIGITNLELESNFEIFNE